MCALGAQNVNGRSQIEMDGFGAEVTRYAQEGDEFLDSIVTGDETWGFHHTPESKQQSLQWRHTHSPRTKKFKTSVSVKKSWRPFSGIEKAFSWSTSCLLAQQLMPLHIVIP